MQISDGSYVVPYELEAGEQLIRASTHDVEEISKQGKALNPINLFVLGSKFRLGRLFLTNYRLILLPFSDGEIMKGRMVEKIGHAVAGKTGINVPQAKINFERDILQISLDTIHTLNPYRKQFFIHPTLYVYCEQTQLRFKFVPMESPEDWANDIADYSHCSIQDIS
ncbi:MAG: hypothetical protein BMS9Abin22_362 [Gammaproteobacteria bacterium]|nr:MAG: hypothetical protein BMS9Abin22_362 [Gammaproteobacteria bacterium]